MLHLSLLTGFTYPPILVNKQKIFPDSKCRSAFFASMRTSRHHLYGGCQERWYHALPTLLIDCALLADPHTSRQHAHDQAINMKQSPTQLKASFEIRLCLIMRLSYISLSKSSLPHQLAKIPINATSTYKRTPRERKYNEHNV